VRNQLRRIAISCDLGDHQSSTWPASIAAPRATHSASDELTHEEGNALIDQIADMHIPSSFLQARSMKRKDVFDSFAMPPAKTLKLPSLPAHAAAYPRRHLQAQGSGIVRLGISLDGSTLRLRHFRGWPRLARTIQAIEWANEAGIPIRYTPPSAVIMLTTSMACAIC